MGQFLTGSIEISKVPKHLFKKVQKADGTFATFLNIAVSERKEKGKYDETHGVQWSWEKDHIKVEGENNFFGSLKTWEQVVVTPEQITNAPATEESDLPF